ncbi:MAG: hypothetical protein AAGB32_03965 [Pseudomonadota bacterium]
MAITRQQFIVNFTAAVAGLAVGYAVLTSDKEITGTLPAPVVNTFD